MEFWIKAVQLVLSLSILVFLHELGHFIPARIFKTRVEKFYLFFNPGFSLFKRKIGETEWGIGWLPLGGYVKIAGMVDESMDKEQLSKPPQPWEFRSKPAWQRLIIMIGGVVVNIIVGFLIYGMVLGVWGEDKIYTKDLNNGLSIHPYMQKFGLHSGDNILEINDVPVSNPNDITAGIMFRNQYKLKVQRKNGTIETIQLNDGVEYEIYENGALPIVGLRHKSTTVGKIVSTGSISNRALGEISPNMLSTGDILLEINDKPISEIQSQSDINFDKPLKAKVIHQNDTLLIDVKTDMINYFLNSFPAFVAGIREGDQLIAIDNKPIEYFDEIVGALYNSKEKTTPISVLRNGDTLHLSANVTANGTLGFAPVPQGYEDSVHIHHMSYGFLGSINHGITKGITTLQDYIGQLKFLFTAKGATQVGGFASIGNLFAPTWDWQIFWERTALISIILAFMNILPIPALDGGHVVFLLYEIITRRKPPQKVLEYAQMIGFFILIALLLYANGNDVFKLLFGN